MPINKLLRLLYPKRCMLCDDLLVYGAPEDICADCVPKIPEYLAAPRRVLATPYGEITRVYAVFRYDGHIRDAVTRLKFRRMKENAKIMASLMVSVIAASDWPEDFWDILDEADFMIPVPLHKSRLRRRGFNQAELLARSLAHLYNLTVSTALIRTKKTGPMYNLPKDERRQNISGAFTVSPNVYEDKNVILIDDIFTTGSTAEEAVRTLKESGARSVCILAFAAGGD